ncbi:hypothetical protein R3W88_027166 [Solanum pinnatisectum]|uniref:RNase H type-1 domain-containing protein n=1 Tax=Solanum pinnatisectum TaxID=50273 RepID=A0AAV9LFA5_9SOLN|nr:hypothetical protein R3W88_027166 [Solanum pinnatisectum]
MYHQCQLTIHQLIRVKFPWIKGLSCHWSEMVDTLKSYKPTLYFRIIKWLQPKEGWITCNTDGASKGNPGQSAYGFCVRDSSRDLIYAEAQSLGIATNMEAEEKTVLEALKYCIRKKLNQVQLETDSLVLKNIINKNWRIPWELVEIMEDIHNMLGKITLKVRHIFKEAN